MLLRELPVDLDDLSDAAERPVDGWVSYLDRETGEVHTLSEELFGDEPTEDYRAWAESTGEAWPEEYEELARRIGSDVQGRYLHIPRDETCEAYHDMVAFIATVDDPHERDLLEVAIDGAGAFGRFRGVLFRYPAERERWFEFQHDRALDRLSGWLETQGIRLIAR